MSWDYDMSLATADKHVFFNYMVKSIAEKDGLRATFMPKPPRALEGSEVLREGLGQDVVGPYLKLKREDWNAYARHLTEWERQTTLDC